MNLALSDEQELLREAARGALVAPQDRRGRARGARGPAALPDLWPTAVEAGWPGLLIAEEHGGAGLGAFDAMLVAQECGRVLAGVPLLGHLPASALLDAAGHDALESRGRAARRAPPGCPRARRATLDAGWTVERERGAGRAPAPTARSAATP